MYVSGPINVGRAVQTLWCYALEIMEQKKCLELLAQKFDEFQTLCNNSQLLSVTLQQGLQTDARCNTRQSWALLACINVASVCIELNRGFSQGRPVDFAHVP